MLNGSSIKACHLGLIRGIFALILGTFGLGSIVRGQSPETVADMLPAEALSIVSVPDLPAFLERFKATDLGQLASDPQTQPFFESMGRQIEERMFGGFQRVLTIDDLKGVRTGEVAQVSLLSDAGRAADALIVDVRGNEEAAVKLLDRVGSNLVAQRADEQALAIGEARVRQFILPPRQGDIARPKIQLLLYRGWIVVSDDLFAARILVQGLDGGYLDQSLAQATDFRRVVDRLAQGRGNSVPELAWFVRPFPLFEAVKAAQPDPGEFAAWGAALASTGFDAIRGIGGDVRFDVDSFDIHFQTFLVVPGSADLAETLTGSARMLTFGSKPEGLPIEISRHVSQDAATVVSGYWDVGTAFASAEPLIDRKYEDETFRGVIESLKQDLQVDLHDLSQGLGPGFTYSTEVLGPPFQSDSEKILLCVEISDSQKVMAHLPGYLSTDQYEPIDLSIGGKLVPAWEYKNAQEDDDPLNAVLGNPGGQSQAGKQDEPPVLRAAAIIGDEFLMASDLEYLKFVLSRQNPIATDSSLLALQTRLREAVGTEPAMMRFARPDRVHRLTYELSRSGKLTDSDTLVERFLRMLDKTEPGARRTPQIDAQRLPEDYEAVIAPRLNPAGWVMLVEPDGWYVVGGITKGNE